MSENTSLFNLKMNAYRHTTDWHSNVHNSKERLDFLHRNQVFADVTFVVGSEKPQRITAHKLVLSMCSQVFSAMFYGPLAEKPETEIAVPDVEPDEWKTLIRFMYTDEIKLSNTPHAIKTAYAAKKYLLNELYDKCMEYMNNNKSFSTVCQIHEAAYYLDNQQLERDTLYMIIENAEKVLEETNPASLTHFILKKIMKQQFLPSLKESTLFRKTTEWIEQNSDDKTKRRQLLEEFLPSIRFLTMDTSNFIAVCAKSDLLTDSEVVSIAYNLDTPGCRPLPAWCNPETKCRIGQQTIYCPLQCSGDATFRESETVKVKCSFEAEEGSFLFHGVDFNRLLRPAKISDVLEMDVDYCNEKSGKCSIFAASCSINEFCKFPCPELIMQGDKCSLEITLQNPPKFYGRADIYKEMEVKVGSNITIKLLNNDKDNEKSAKMCGLFISLLE